MRDEEKGSGSNRPARRSSRISSTHSEFEFINQLRKRASEQKHDTLSPDSAHITHHTSLLHGIGDDAAVIRQHSGRDSVITTDLLVEEIDFRLETTSPVLLGHKALAVSLSDIAAMGARPRWAMLSVGVPRRIWRTGFLDDFYEGFFALANRYGVALIGGDVSRTPDRIVIDAIMLGETRRKRAVLRTGARPGDHIFVTGALGGAAAGLKLLELGARLSAKESQLKGRKRALSSRAIKRLLLRQLRPEPRLDWGATLGENQLATAMIDVSDGLSSDLTHLCRESGVGALIEASRIPVEPTLAKNRELDLDPLSLALNGGEDFELLFTVRPRNLARLPAAVEGVPATYLGDVTKETDGLLISYDGDVRSLDAAGFNHFGRLQS
jgi:thiamine-monophosphate kinase